MICAKSGQNWSSAFGEEVENVKVYRQTDDGQRAIRIAHLSFQLRWAKNYNMLFKIFTNTKHDETLNTMLFRIPVFTSTKYDAIACCVSISLSCQLEVMLVSEYCWNCTCDDVKIHFNSHMYHFVISM
jgi:hypothetical protein